MVTCHLDYIVTKSDIAMRVEKKVNRNLLTNLYRKIDYFLKIKSFSVL